MPLSPANAFYLMIGLLSFLLMGIDKYKSVRKQWRISEITFMGLSILGGAPGVLAGMLVFRHKIRKPLFYLGIPAIYLFHRALLTPLLLRILIEAGFGW
ncbi:DUF1294 domain-containing protein [Anoxynatronum buryatiense]|uniref:Uncharacterized membrane protein YsdA, DUF1294 family n=1 Tax=Anoxynatronum buryatiense TaxID=489973 RepID=A0AA45WSQ3_9CLOT|nr:DUF1294 domain-containing protein [Anoxynatronum buryatiense]SMP38854.1 Uncharacterized membrane protein YsdA, DUF1294 family [Anoxynatronum buryatiense]